MAATGLRISLLAFSILLAQQVRAQASYKYVPLGACPGSGSSTVAPLMEASSGYIYYVVTSGNYEESCIVAFRPGVSPVFQQVFEVAGSDSAYSQFGPSLTEGPDGAIYGMLMRGGPGGYGAIFRIAGGLGDPEILYNINQPLGYRVGVAGPVTYLVFGSDGALYGTVPSADDGITNGAIFRFDIQTRQFTVLHRYDYAPLFGQVESGPDGLLEVTPGVFAGIIESYGSYAGTLLSVTPNGSYDQLYSFPVAGLSNPVGQMASAEDGYAYGFATDVASQYQAMYRYNPAGALTSFHVFSGMSPGPETGVWPAGGANLIGALTNGGTYERGSVFQLSTAGTYIDLHDFDPEGETVDGSFPVAAPIVASDGALYGTTTGGENFYGPISSGLYRIVPETPLEAPVTLSASVATVAAGTPIHLSWKVGNAYSTTMRQCHAAVQGGYSGAGDWSGPQNGSTSGGYYSGSATVTPTNTGTLTYALNCGGVESGFATVVVTGAAKAATATHILGSPQYALNADSLDVNVTVDSVSGTPTGTVSLYANGVLAGSAALIGNPGDTYAIFSAPASAFPAGTYTLTAVYNGDAKNAASTSSTFTEVLLPKQTTPGIAPEVDTATTATCKNGVTVGASVYPLYADGVSISATPVPSGTIQVYLGTTLAGSAELTKTSTYVSSANVVIHPVNCAQGVYPLTVKYLGDSYFVAATASTSLLVSTDPTETLLTASNLTFTRGQQVTLEADVYDNSTNAGVASGSVDFYADGQKVGTAALNASGVASLTESTASLPAGTYPVQAVYTAAPGFASSSSATLLFTLK